MENKIALTIKKLRNEAHLTQKQLAEETGISLSAIIAYENSRREPNSKSMSILEKYFNVSGAFLRGETDQKIPMERWEDPETMKTIDEETKIIMETILKSLPKQNKPTRDDFFKLLVELRRVLDYDYEIQSYILDILIKCLYTTTRLTDISYHLKGDGYDEDIRYHVILEKGIEEITNNLASISSYIEFD